MSKKQAPATVEVEETPVETPDEAKGSGIFTFPDGGKYDGEFESCQQVTMRHGHGTHWNGPEKYTGTWSKDTMDGKGVYSFASGAVYEGEFKANLFCGNGTYRWSDGATYVGQWRESKMHGSGCYTDKDGVEWRGTFFNGKFDNGRAFLTLR
ncbi:hypothetical protein SDRG_00787 [Saprolegnia diclina VS20]|uniref:MORN repeat-containing protein 5 n=1 Tax=Saprolegnia diclina (strain VS20) TaxID=1156394 RepID=T0QUQ9_SAPDV|nr:hypothetical protein SDRG_00787 [Saprolegnia diclina VS20]EQC41934.1 hypothetical protein SDRG_00787 [Saprolegnia diclina VS20]|eukprot:XP_008604503.1 hypothetical protein SDRG_00787 [Saprolegnia diclina VS20]